MLTRLIVAFPSAARSLAPRLHVNSAELKSVPLLRLNRGPPLPRARSDFFRTLRIALQHQRSFRIPASLDPRGLSVRVNRKQVKRSNYGISMSIERLSPRAVDSSSTYLWHSAANLS